MYGAEITHVGRGRRPVVEVGGANPKIEGLGAGAGYGANSARNKILTGEPRSQSVGHGPLLVDAPAV